MYNKAFTEVVMVKLTTDKVGNQLQIGSDVKARGVIVGEVRKITPTADGAQLDLALNPDQAKLLPNTVSARFLPKTLFGERYVALQLPKESGGTPLAAGNAIAQDTSARAAELETAFEHLLPVLQAVQPAKLSSTLTAISTALQGRGKPLGETLTDLGDLVGEINPHLPQLEHDLRVLTTVSDTYADAAPDLVSALDDLTVTSQTVVDQRSNLDALYASVTTASRDLDSFLRVNQGNLIQLADTSRPTLELLAKYAPEYPCFLKQIAETVPVIDTALGKGTNQPGLHATIEVVVNRGPYKPGKDEPRYEDTRGPRCYDFKEFPTPFPQNPPDGPLKDGSTQPPPARVAQDGLIPGATVQNALPGTSPNAASGLMGMANSPAEGRFIAALIGPGLGIDPGNLPDWNTLLLGPAFRGAEVSFK